MLSTKQMIGAFLQQTALEELGDEYTILAQRNDAHRKTHGGRIPRAIFGPSIGIGGVSYCVEIAYLVKDAGGKIIGIAMKKRETDDVNDPWKDLYHGTGTVIGATELKSNARRRAVGEATDNLDHYNPDFLSELGSTIHDEPERWSVCKSTIYGCTVTEEEVRAFKGTWKIFTDFANAEIINHHQQMAAQIMKWALGEDEREEVDIRSYPVVTPQPAEVANAS